MSHDSSYFTAFLCGAKKNRNLKLLYFQNRELHDAETFLEVSGVFRLSELNHNIPSYFGLLWWKTSKNQGLC